MDSQYTTQSAAAADDVERAATGSLDNLAIRVAATGSLLSGLVAAHCAMFHRFSKIFIYIFLFVV